MGEGGRASKLYVPLWLALIGSDKDCCRGSRNSDWPSATSSVNTGPLSPAGCRKGVAANVYSAFTYAVLYIHSVLTEVHDIVGIPIHVFPSDGAEKAEAQRVLRLKDTALGFKTRCA